MGSNRINLLEIYSKYRDIILGNEYANSKEPLSLLSKLVELGRQTSDRDMVFDDLSKLMALLDLNVDSLQFKMFYDFVFFICRENGQKRITISRAIAAWRLVLAGRFRLLNQWCDFVEKHQRHNISEDMWQQLLVFSRCVNEDLEGYDPQGSWPVLIDEFVEHMHRVSPSNSCSTRNFSGECSGIEPPPCNGAFPGLKAHPGSKRKSPTGVDSHEDEALNSLPYNSTISNHCSKCKRNRQSSFADKMAYGQMSPSEIASDSTYDHTGTSKLSGYSNNSACGAVNNLAKGLEGLSSTGYFYPFDQGRDIFFTVLYFNWYVYSFSKLYLERCSIPFILSFCAQECFDFTIRKRRRRMF
ncbi:LOW QUALITY PROTEIN: defective in cullin neddylation protein (DUF298) [Tasmannia lanceolata]|uniref:LOW QUALITY PROTEIN: defective in cullin neddylation protein (DUF298) n=1 Tax=Tasmannia lanceolata TaxID=3420 RepID=UPI00406383D3